MTEDPVGSLIRTAERKARKKAGHRHTAYAPCGCEVEIQWFPGATSYRAGITRCREHRL